MKYKGYLIEGGRVYAQATNNGGKTWYKVDMDSYPNTLTAKRAIDARFGRL